MVFNDNADNI